MLKRRPCDQDPCDYLKHKRREAARSARSDDKEVSNHVDKLDRYRRDPLSGDNRGHLQQALDEGNLERYWHIVSERIRKLEGEIEILKRSADVNRAVVDELDKRMKELGC